MKRTLLFIILCPLLIIYSCQDMTEAPTYDNPFDVQNIETEGDPFNLKIEMKNNIVYLKWSKIDVDFIEGYHIYRSTDDISDFVTIASTSTHDTTYVDTTITKGHGYWYKVVAYNAGGEESSQSNILPAGIFTEPKIIINEGETVSYEQLINLVILAPSAKEMWISNFADFNDGSWEAYNTHKQWQLPETEGKLSVYVKVRYEDGTISAPFFASIILDLTSPPLIYIPSGEFTMGSDETDGDIDEHPKHEVYLDAYWIDKYEVTNAQYAYFLSVGNDAHFHNLMKIEKKNDGSYAAKIGYENHPVVYVSYEDAVAYAQWRDVSLPTEAQWEKAARGTDERVYPWGNNFESNRCNYWNSDDPFEKDSTPYTTPVGFYNGQNNIGYATKNSPSFYGVYDMAGNVWEMCSDWYQTDYYSQSSPNNPSGPASGIARVIRGGSWMDEDYYMRSSSRSFRPPSKERWGDIGFRCVINE